VGHVYPSPTLWGMFPPHSLTLKVREGETDKVGKPSVRQTDIRRTDIVGEPTLGKPL